MTERLYKLTEKGKAYLTQLKYNKKEKRVNMVSMVENILMIIQENKSSQASSQDEKESK